jgi:hypothetical protein
MCATLGNVHVRLEFAGFLYACKDTGSEPRLIRQRILSTAENESTARSYMRDVGNSYPALVYCLWLRVIGGKLPSATKAPP